MRLPCRRERVLDADVQLAAAAERKPGAAARAQRLGLLDLLQAEQAAEEPPRLGLAAGRRGDLHVVELDHSALSAAGAGSAGVSGFCFAADAAAFAPPPFRLRRRRRLLRPPPCFGAGRFSASPSVDFLNRAELLARVVDQLRRARRYSPRPRRGAPRRPATAARGRL